MIWTQPPFLNWLLCQNMRSMSALQSTTSDLTDFLDSLSLSLCLSLCLSRSVSPDPTQSLIALAKSSKLLPVYAQSRSTNIGGFICRRSLMGLSSDVNGLWDCRFVGYCFQDLIYPGFKRWINVFPSVLVPFEMQTFIQDSLSNKDNEDQPLSCG